MWYNHISDKLNAGDEIMGLIDILIIVAVVVVALVVGLYFLNRWASKRMSNQQDVMNKNRQPASIFVIDKKRDKAANVHLPKVVMDNLPRTAKLMKMYFIKAKIGPQIMTLMCDKNIFLGLQPKKNYQVELAGIYIISAKGVKSQAQLKAIAKDKRKQAKLEARKS